jgi:hypothetical protein
VQQVTGGKEKNIHSFINGSTAFCWPLAAFSVLQSYTQSAGLLGRGISPSQGSYLYTGQHKQKKRTPAFIPGVGFEPTIPALKQAKTVHASDRAL